MAGDPALHAGGPVLQAGPPLADARAAIVMLHGRGATAESILSLSEELNVPGFAYLAPQAAGHTWYPYPVLASLASNEPWLSSALEIVGQVLERVAGEGVPVERTFLLGFSQGACLALEYAARNARRYGGVIGLSGGLIGPPGTPRNHAGSLDGAPVFLGCSDNDSHIPKARVEESAEVFRRLGGDVTLRLYRNMGHTVNTDEIATIRTLMRLVV
jgi:predicted esterase